MTDHAEESYVIAGVAGRFPMSNNLEDFWQYLIQGYDMVSGAPIFYPGSTYTVRFEAQQAAEVHAEKKAIYDPCLTYFCEKYGTSHDQVIGLVGARGPISNMFEEFRTIFHLPKVLTEEFSIAAIRGSYDIQRWDHMSDGATSRCGRIKNAEKFDAEYFAVPGNQADVMDPRLRILLELYVESLFDAGVNPNELSGTNTGVFAGSSGEEGYEIWKRSNASNVKYVVLGGSSIMLSNRISYVLNLTGPSLTLDTGCSSSLIALQYALLCLKSGLCSSALVSGVSMLFDPRTSAIFNSGNFLSPDGKCKTFDNAADGYVRSESAAVLYVCHDNGAKRRYATVVHTKVTNDGYKPQGVTYPSRVSQEQLIKDCYAECGVNPNIVEYLEIHGTGTRLGDIEEGAAVASVFCEGRKRTLLVGCVKSNLGHSEAASGLVGIIKILLSYQHGTIPANLHFKNPNKNIPALISGLIKVVSEPTPFIGTYAAVNAWGIGGTNAHILLKFHPNASASHEDCDSQIPVFAPISGRTHDTVAYQLERIVDFAWNRNLIVLIHEIYKENITRHEFRGYALIISGVPEVKIKKGPTGINHSIWFIFSGLCAQDVAINDCIPRFELFQQSIQSSLSILSNLVPDILGEGNTCFDKKSGSTIEAIVTTTVIQIALTDTLSSIGILPEGIIGYSIGEIAAGYADMCITREEAILVSSATSSACAGSDEPSNHLIDVHLTWDEVLRRLPHEIYPVTYNSQECIRITGPAEAIQNFSHELETDGVRFEYIQFGRYALHYPLMAVYGSKIRDTLQHVTLHQRTRSAKWLSTSVPDHHWKSEAGKYASIDYYISNISSPVYFHTTLLHVPENSIILELGPVEFLRSIIAQSKNFIAVIGMMNLNSEEFFLRSLGNLYHCGVNFDTKLLYPPVSLPVDSKTPSISPMIQWFHKSSWGVPNANKESRMDKKRIFTIDLRNPDFSFLMGHSVNGRVVIPAAGYIWLVWTVFAAEKRTTLEQLPVVLENLQFEKAVYLSPEKPTEIEVTICPYNGFFEVLEGEIGVCQGRIQVLTENVQYKLEASDAGKGLAYPGECFYKELRLRGYEYSGVFQGLQLISFDGKWAELKWQENWTAFLDTLMQALIPLANRRQLMIPVRLEKVTINPILFQAQGNHGIIVNCCKYLKLAQCVGIELYGGTTKLLDNRMSHDVQPTLGEFRFDWFYDESAKKRDFEEIIEFYIGIAIDNTFSETIIFSEIVSQATESVAHEFRNLCSPKFPQPRLNLITRAPIQASNCTDTTDADIVASTSHLSGSNCIYTNLLDTDVPQISELITEGGFVISRSICNHIGEYIPELVVISMKRIQDGWMHLYRKRLKIKFKRRFINLQGDSFSWVENLKMELLSEADSRLFLTSHSHSGIIGFMKCLILEGWSNNVRCIYSLSSDRLNLEDKSLTSHLNLDLLFNVQKDNRWGCYSCFTITRRVSSFRRCSQYLYAFQEDLGDLSSLQWVESPLKYFSKELCVIKFAPIAFKDVLLATGRIKSEVKETATLEDQMLGYECAGVYKGNRVISMARGTAIATAVDVDPRLLLHVPQWWTLAEGATVPVAYYTAYTALVHRGRLKYNESVLIHSGAGSTGLALITLALHHGCTVFTTAGSPGRRNFLVKWFPMIKPEHVSDSRSEKKFEQCVIQGTLERGVDVVVNSLVTEKLKASLRCLAKNGRFLEIGITDMLSNTQLGMDLLLKNIDIQSIIMPEQPEEVIPINKLIKLGIEYSVVRPLPYVCFAPDKLAEAFKFMTSSHRIGKVHVELTHNYNIPAQPRSYFYPNKVYIIVGGLGGMGLELCIWMSERNVKILVLCSRPGPLTAYQSYRIQYLQKTGVTVVVSYGDITTQNAVESVITESKAYGPIGGIFNVALVLRDGCFLNQTPDSFTETCNVKVDTTLHFDMLSRLMLPELDHFVVFSSLTAARGYPSQTNYGYANSTMERICEKRKLDGLPALAIQWGAIGDVGYVADTIQNISPDFKRLWMEKQTLKSWLKVLDMFLEYKCAVVSSFVQPISSIENASWIKVSVLDAVSRITGTQDLWKYDSSTTLSDLGVDSFMIIHIKKVIMDHPKAPFHKIVVSERLTLGQLRELDSHNTEIPPQDT